MDAAFYLNFTGGGRTSVGDQGYQKIVLKIGF